MASQQAASLRPLRAKQMQTILSDGGDVYKFWKKSSLGNANRICSKFQSLGHLHLLPGHLKHGDCEMWKDTPYDYPYHENYLVICESRRRVSLLNCILHVTSIFSVLPCKGQGSIRERERENLGPHTIIVYLGRWHRSRLGSCSWSWICSWM